MTLKAILFAALNLLAVVANADVRVLIEYDNKEHRVLQIVELEAKKAAPISDHLRQSVASIRATQNAGSHGVKVLWTASDGTLLRVDTILDPRSTHAPLKAENQVQPSVVGLEAGAYVVDGPIGSAYVEVQFPAHTGLGIGAQSWRFDLTS